MFFGGDPFQRRGVANNPGFNGPELHKFLILNRNSPILAGR
jgi:hypothetical protein